MKKILATIVLALVLSACNAGTVTTPPTQEPVRAQIEYPHVTARFFLRGVMGGDCFADGATGDIYPQPDPYCGTDPRVVELPSISKDKVVAEATQVPQIGTDPTVVPTSVTPDPTQPAPEPTAEPTQPAPEPAPACHNPNSGREAAPGDCNAGGGQEKKG